MIKLRLALPWILAAGITLVAGVLYGRWTNRWGTPEMVSKAAAVFEQLPREFGAWHLVESQPLSPDARGILQCNRDTQSLYENQQTGERVVFTLLLGPPGPMSVHTPEICYASIDHVPLAERRRIELEPKQLNNHAWMIQFRDLHESQGEVTRIYYAWSEDGNWNAVEEPRITFGGSPYLFKMQLLVRLPEEMASVEKDPARSFLEEFLPAFAHAAKPLRHGES